MELELRDIKKSFGEKEVLRGVSFTASAGSAFGLLGRNGAGKTTTLRILIDVFPADSGSVLLDGRPIDYSCVRMGYLPEERGLYPKKKVIDQLVYFARLRGMGGREAAGAIDSWLERLGMGEYRNNRLDMLSKGNQQKIQLITALVHDPEIVILDEPFSGLDPVNAVLLKDVVKEEIARGKIVIFSSHQMNYIEEFCDRIAILNGGSAALCGDLRDIKHSYARDRLVVRSAEREAIMRELGDICSPLEDGALLLHLPSPESKRETMSRLAGRYELDELRVYEPTLGDIFVQYAGDKPQGGVL